MTVKSRRASQIRERAAGIGTAAKVNDEYRTVLDEFLERVEYLAQAIEAVDEAARKDFKLTSYL